MFKVSFKKGKFNNNISLLDFAEISGVENPCAAKIEGKIFELSHNLSDDCEVEFLTFDDIEGKEISGPYGAGIYSHRYDDRIFQGDRRCRLHSKNGRKAG